METEEIISILVNLIFWYVSAWGVCMVPPTFQFQPHDNDNINFQAETIILLMKTPFSASPLPWGHLHLTTEASLDKKDARSSKG